MENTLNVISTYQINEFDQFKKKFIHNQNHPLYHLQKTHGKLVLDIEKLPISHQPEAFLKLVRDLTENGTIATYEAYDFNLCLKEPLPFIRTIEMPPSMRKFAALQILKVIQILEKNNYLLFGITPLSMTLNTYGKPVLVDLLHIAPKQLGFSNSFEDFNLYYLNYLSLLSRRPQLSSDLQDVEKISLNLLNEISRPKIYKLLERIFKTTRFGVLIDLLQPFNLSSNHFTRLSSLLRTFIFQKVNIKPKVLNFWETQIESLNVTPSITAWSGYHDFSHDDILKNPDWKILFKDGRSKVIFDLLDNENRGTLLDIGANRGLFSCLASQLGFDVTSCDYDIKAMDDFFVSLKKHNFTHKIKPIILNFSTLPYQELWRFKSDVVLALGFSHHMRMAEYIPWEKLAEKLSLLTHRTLITDFKLQGKPRGNKKMFSEKFLFDYNADTFISGLKKYFSEVIPMGVHKQSEGGGARLIIKCRK